MSIATIEDKETWDRFIDNSPYGTIFHKWDFLHIVEKHSGYKLLTYGVFKGDHLMCVFPLFLKTYFGMTLLFSPPPQSGIPHLGFVMDPLYDTIKQHKKEQYLDAVVDEIEAKVMELSPNYASITMVPGFMDIRAFKWKGYEANINYSYAIDLRPSLDEIWGRLSENIKKNIKACTKYPISVKQANDVDTLYQALTDRYGQQGLKLPIYSAAYLQELQNAYPDNIKQFFLYLDQDISAVYMICEYNDTFIVWLGGVAMQRQVPVNDHIHWEFIKMAKCADHCKTFLLVGANTKHLCTYKSKYNPTLVYSFRISKMDTLGKIAEYSYTHLLKKKAHS